MVVTEALPRIEVVTVPERAPASIGAQHPPARANHFYRPELDMLRLLAFFMVWSAHALIPFAGLLPVRVLAAVEGAGSCGVPVFFFLSAFLITELLRRERTATGGVRLRLFYLRRALRIWPLYFGILALYALLGLRWHGFRIEPVRLAASCLLAGNWYIALHPWIKTPLRALWTISVEEQWYLLAPLVERWVSRRTLGLLCITAVCVSAASLTLLAHAADASQLHVTAWVNSVVQFQYLAMGALAALLLNGHIPEMSPYARASLVVAAAAAILLAAVWCRIREAGVSHSAGSLVFGYLLAGAGAACLFFACFGVAPARCPRALVQLGQLSYGLYMLHETAFFLADTLGKHLHLPQTLASLSARKLLALLLTVALAWLSFRFWELPFLRLKERWTVIRTRVPA